MKNISHFRFFFLFTCSQKVNEIQNSRLCEKDTELNEGFFFDRALNFEFHLSLAKVSEILNSVKSEFL